MAVKVWDGFDHYNSASSSSDDFWQRSGFLQWQHDSSGGAGNKIFVTGRNGNAKALEVTGGTQGYDFQAVLDQRVASQFVGFATKMTVTSGGYEFQFMDSVAGSVQCSVFFNGLNYSIAVYRGTKASGTLLYTSANNRWTPNVWNYVEVWPIIDDSVGRVRVRINNVVAVDVSGLDTKATANAWWDVMRIIISGAGTVKLTVDDFYAADDVTGPGTYPCNDFLGDVRVQTLFPTGDDAVQWTPNAGGNNWSRVSELAMDSDTTYNYTSTANNQDTFTLDDLSGTIAVLYGVQVTVAYRKDDASARKAKNAVKPTATTYLGAEVSMPDNAYAYFTELWVLNPETGLNWTSTDVNGSKAGYKLTA